LAIGRDHLDTDEIVTAQTMLVAQPAYAAAQGQPGDACVGDETAGGGEPAFLGCAIQFAPGQAGLGADGAPRRIDLDLLHRREVDDEAAVADRIAGHVVAASPHCNQEVMRASELDDPDYIVRAGAARDQRRSPVDHPVPHRARRVIIWIACANEFAAQAGCEHLHSRPVKRDDRTIACRQLKLSHWVPHWIGKWPALCHTNVSIRAIPRTVTCQKIG
jgi:hypothetical protein